MIDLIRPFLAQSRLQADVRFRKRAVTVLTPAERQQRAVNDRYSFLHAQISRSRTRELWAQTCRCRSSRVVRQDFSWPMTGLSPLRRLLRCGNSAGRADCRRSLRLRKLRGGFPKPAIHAAINDYLQPMTEMRTMLPFDINVMDIRHAPSGDQSTYVVPVAQFIQQAAVSPSASCAAPFLLVRSKVYCGMLEAQSVVRYC